MECLPSWPIWKVNFQIGCLAFRALHDEGFSWRPHGDSNPGSHGDNSAFSGKGGIRPKRSIAQQRDSLSTVVLKSRRRVHEIGPTEPFCPVPIETKLSGLRAIRCQTAFATIILFSGSARDVHLTSLLRCVGRTLGNEGCLASTSLPARLDRFPRA
jgi:hypothetical protein